MLWIALYLPELPLQLSQRASHGNERVAAQNENLDAEALHGLACWASQFTPSVVLQPGEGLLLDVGTTLQLHRGLKTLLARIRSGVKELGYHVEPGVALTPLAAWLLAKARCIGIKVRMCLQTALLVERLAPLPLSLLDWPAAMLTTLHTLGIHSMQQCFDLPRDGFIQRFGAARRLELDKAIGTAPDPRPWFTPPEHFSNRLEFGFEINDAMMLLFPLKRLLQQLEGFLRGRGAGVQQWQLVLEHSKQQKTLVTMGVSAPERSAERFLALARERLAQTTLTATVIGLGLNAEQLLEFDESNRSFVPDPRAQAIGWAHLIDKLDVRLGKHKVYCLHALDDHRPEAAWKQQAAIANHKQQPKASAVPLIKAPRPLWLLKEPRALRTDAGKPLYQGKLHMLAGPERIEAGWWDSSSDESGYENGDELRDECKTEKRVRRDYYVARNNNGETFWIYREHSSTPTWFLQGIFG
jgi:protein ImuB